MAGSGSASSAWAPLRTGVFRTLWIAALCAPCCAALFLVPASALWALLPLIATRRLGLGSGGYGVLLGALGVGAIGGSGTLPFCDPCVTSTWPVSTTSRS